MVHEALRVKSKHLCNEFQLNCKDPTCRNKVVGTTKLYVKVLIHHSRKISVSDKKCSGNTNKKFLKLANMSVTKMSHQVSSCDKLNRYHL